MLLSAVKDGAKERGWLVVGGTTSPGFVHRVTAQHLPRLLRGFDPETVNRRLSGLNLLIGPFGAAGATWDTLDAHVVEVGLRNQIELLTDLLAENETGYS